MTAWLISALGLLASVAVGFALARTQRRAADYGDDVVTLFCRHCHREPGCECTCRMDCGRPDCPWPLLNARYTDAEISAWLETLKGGTGQ